MSRALPLVVLVALLAACGGGGDDGGGDSIDASKGPSLVLTPADVGSAFGEFDSGAQQPADFNPPRNDPERFGRQGGWKARFKPRSPKAAQNVLIIDSSADLFDSAEGAGQDFDLYKQYLDQFLPANGKRLDPPDLGDESYAVTFRQGLPPTITRYYYVAWRDGNATAALFVNGDEGKTSLDDLLGYARKQQSRIQAAAATE